MYFLRRDTTAGPCPSAMVGQCARSSRGDMDGRARSGFGRLRSSLAISRDTGRFPGTPTPQARGRKPDTGSENHRVLTSTEGHISESLLHERWPREPRPRGRIDLGPSSSISKELRMRFIRAFVASRASFLLVSVVSIQTATLAGQCPRLADPRPSRGSVRSLHAGVRGTGMRRDTRPRLPFRRSAIPPHRPGCRSPQGGT